MANSPSWTRCIQHDGHFLDCLDEPHGHYVPLIQMLGKSLPEEVQRTVADCVKYVGGKPETWLLRIPDMTENEHGKLTQLLSEARASQPAAGE